MSTSQLNFFHNFNKGLIFKLAGIILVVCIIVLANSYTLWHASNFRLSQSDSNDTLPQPDRNVSLYIYEGDSFDTVLCRLRPFLVSPKRFEKAARKAGYPDRIHSGHYVLTEGMNNRQMIRIFQRGLQTPVRICFSIVRTPEQLAGILSRQIMLDSATIISAFRNADRLKALGMDRQTLPALFIPDTYEVWWNTSADKLMSRFEQAYNQYWTKERISLVNANGLTPIEAATLASIVQDESNVKSEWPIIAGLYLNRLRKKIPLQACPTIKYVMNDFSMRRVLKEYTEVESPYNTYLHQGLPPGPIGIASKQVLDAVVNAKPNSYLYMCAKDDFSGGHYFSTNLTQHNIYAMRYHTALTKKRIWR